jgi:hypothetical protein
MNFSQDYFESEECLPDNTFIFRIAQLVASGADNKFHRLVYKARLISPTSLIKNTSTSDKRFTRKLRSYGHLYKQSKKLLKNGADIFLHIDQVSKLCALSGLIEDSESSSITISALTLPKLSTAEWSTRINNEKSKIDTESVLELQLEFVSLCLSCELFGCEFREGVLIKGQLDGHEQVALEVPTHQSAASSLVGISQKGIHLLNISQERTSNVVSWDLFDIESWTYTLDEFSWCEVKSGKTIRVQTKSAYVLAGELMKADTTTFQ